MNLYESVRSFLGMNEEGGGRTMTFFHGGNLKTGAIDSVMHKKGRWEYGPGLYLTTNYRTAADYAKGSRKLYEVVVEEGNDIDTAWIDFEEVKSFAKYHIIGNKRKEILSLLVKRLKNGKVPAWALVNLIINDNAIQSKNTNELRNFLVENGVDYSIVDSPFGWGEKMLVLFNFDKIIDIRESKDRYEDFPIEFS